MNKNVKRFTLWTTLVTVTGICVGAAGKVALDTLAARNGWHWGGEVMVLLALVALPLEWLVRKIFRCVMAGMWGWSEWK